jgi:hypothetical protein
MFKHQHRAYFIHIKFKTNARYFHIRRVLAFHKTALKQISVPDILIGINSNMLVVFVSESQSFTSNSSTPPPAHFLPIPLFPASLPRCRSLVSHVAQARAEKGNSPLGSRSRAAHAAHRCLASLLTRLGASRLASRRIAACKHPKKDRKKKGGGGVASSTDG